MRGWGSHSCDKVSKKEEEEEETIFTNYKTLSSNAILFTKNPPRSVIVIFSNTESL